MGLILALRSDTLRSNVLPPINDDSANPRGCHARCFRPTAFAPRHAAVAPAARFAELEVVRPLALARC